MIFEVYGLLDENLCNEIVDYFISTEKTQDSQITDFFKNRTIQLHQIRNCKIRQDINIISHKLEQRLYFQHKEFVFLEFCDIVYWNPGMLMNVHTDNTSGFDSKRDFTAVFYLNDDYDGGQTFLPEHNFICNPKKGKCLVFPSSYPHGVNLIKNKPRYTLMMWFTKDKNHAMLS